MAGTPSTSAGSTLSSLDRGLGVLEAMARRGEARLADLARQLGTSRTTMFRVLETLQARGFAEHVTERHTYRLGPAARSLAAQAIRSEVARLAEPAMADLRSATGETVNLIGVHGGRLVYELVLEGSYSLRSLPNLGMTVAPHCSALGKAVLAVSPPSFREVLLAPQPWARLTEHTITSREQLDAELELIRQRGYAIDNEENETGLTCVAAAILGSGGRPVAAISISGATDRMRRLSIGDLGSRTAAHCTSITEQQS